MRNKRMDFIAIGLILVATGSGGWSLKNFHNERTSDTAENVNDFLLWVTFIPMLIMGLLCLLVLLIGRGRKRAGWILLIQGFIGTVITVSFGGRNVDLPVPFLDGENFRFPFPLLATITYFVGGLLVLIKVYRETLFLPANPYLKSLSPVQLILMILILGPLILGTIGMVFLFGAIVAGRPGPTPTTVFQYLTPTSTPRPTPNIVAIRTGVTGQAVSDGIYALTVTQVEEAASYDKVKARPSYHLVAVKIIFANQQYGSLVDIEPSTFNFYLKDEKGFSYQNLAVGKLPQLPSLDLYEERKSAKSVSGWRTFEIPDNTTHLALQFFTTPVGLKEILLQVDLGNLPGVIPLTPTLPK